MFYVIVKLCKSNYCGY